MVFVFFFFYLFFTLLEHLIFFFIPAQVSKLLKLLTFYQITWIFFYERCDNFIPSYRTFIPEIKEGRYDVWVYDPLTLYDFKFYYTKFKTNDMLGIYPSSTSFVNIDKWMLANHKRTFFLFYFIGCIWVSTKWAIRCGWVRGRTRGSESQRKWIYIFFPLFFFYFFYDVYNFQLFFFF